MNRSSLLISVLGLMLTSFAVMMWLGSEQSVPPAPPASDGPALEIASEVASSAVEAAFVVADPDDEAEDVVDDESREEVVIEMDDSPQLLIQVWTGKRGVVAPEAEVFVLEGYKRSGPRDAFQPHRCELAITLGKRYRASSEGRVAVPRLKADAIVAARLPGAVGMVSVRKHYSESSVVLQPDETVTVRVVGYLGRPAAGVPVGIQQRIVGRVPVKNLAQEWKDVEREIESLRRRIAANPAQVARQRQLAALQKHRVALVAQWLVVKEASAKRGKTRGGTSAAPSKKKVRSKKPKGKVAKAQPAVTTRMDLKARRRTDERGLAVFRHFQLYRERGESWWPKEHQNRFQAVVMVPLAEAVRESFHGKPVPEGIIEMKLPATGSIALRTVDRDGRPFTHPVHGTLRMVDGKNPGWMRVPIRKKQNEREIVFPFVGLGMLMQSTCRLDDEDFRWTSPSFDGPQRAGDHVTVDLVVAPSDAMLHGRVFDVAGTPLANAKTTFLINSIRGRLEGEEVLLDDEGRFHLPFQLRNGHQAPFRLQVRHQDRLPVPGLARTLGVLPKQGVVDLGELQLGVMPPISFGRVVNDLGEGVVGARVQLQRERDVGGRRSRQRWQDEAFTETRSDEAGNFWLYGDLESARYRLRVTAAEHFPFEQPSLPGREGVVIKLPRRSRVVGSVLLPKWLPSRRVKVQLLSHLDPKSNREDKIHDYKGKKLIYFDWTRPGIYSLTFRIDGFPDSFARIDNLEIKGGQMGEHSRLKNIDLGRDIFRFEVLAVDATGKSMTPKSPLLARVMRPNGQYSLLGFSWRRGRVEVFSSQSSLEILPEAQGFRAERTTLVAGRSEVRFTRIPPLVVRAPGMRQLVGEQSVWISLELVGGPKIAEFDSGSRRMARSVRRSTASHGALQDNDTAQLTPVRDGRYRVLARLGNKRRGGLVSILLGEVHVRMSLGGGPQMVTVVVNAPAVQTAMQEVARRAAAAAANPRRSRK